MNCPLTHKDAAKHIRSRLAHEGINARVKMTEFCGERVVKVFVPTYEARFNSVEIKTIALIARALNLTGSRGAEILPDHEAVLTGKQEWSFYL